MSLPRVKTWATTRVRCSYHYANEGIKLHSLSIQCKLGGKIHALRDDSFGDSEQKRNFIQTYIPSLEVSEETNENNAEQKKSTEDVSSSSTSIHLAAVYKSCKMV